MADRQLERSSVPRWRRTAQLFLWIAVGLFLVAGVLLYFGVQQVDPGTANAIAIVCGVLVVACLIMRWVISPHGRMGLRFALACLPISAGIILLACLEFRGFSGEMLPQFRWRGSSRATNVASQNLEDLEVTSKGPRRAFLQFLGNHRTGVIDDIRLDGDWNSSPPRVLWNVACGEGWAGVAVVDQRLVTLEQHDDEEWVTCRDVRNGSLLWKHTTKARHYNVLGGLGPRSTPTIHAGRVYTLGAVGHVACLDLETGKPLWTSELLAIAGTDQAAFELAVAWGYAASPLIVEESVVLPLGNASAGTAHNLVALNIQSGEVQWKGPIKQISYATPTLGSLGGVECIVSVNEDSVTGHSPKDGATLFEFPWPGSSHGSATCSQPLFIGDRLLLSKGYGIGAVLLQFTADGQQLKHSTVWRSPKQLRTKFTSPVLKGEHVFGLSDGILECVRVADGKRVWKGGRYGHGQVLLVGEHLLLTSESGELVLIEANPVAYRELGKIAVLDGITWNIPSLAGDLCFMKNGSSVACVQLPLAVDE